MKRIGYAVRDSLARVVKVKSTGRPLYDTDQGGVSVLDANVRSDDTKRNYPGAYGKRSGDRASQYGAARTRLKRYGRD